MHSKGTTKGNKELAVAVVCGGPSAEAEVSRSTSRGIADALRQRFARVELFELDDQLAGRLLNARPDVVFPGLHGPPGEDGTFQGFLEILGLPYVGSGVLASAIAMDKVVAKALFRAAGLPVASDAVIRHGQEESASLAEVRARLGADVVVKPLAQGSALGVAFASDEETLARALASVRRLSQDVLVEQRVAGKEITCAVLEGEGGPAALPVIEIRTPPNSWYDYEHRYTPGLSQHIVPAELPPEQIRRVQEIAVAAHVALGCRDLSRSDFVVQRAGEPVLLELNTLPGMTPTSLFPDAARAAGIAFDELVIQLVERAVRRAAAGSKDCRSAASR